MVAHYQVEISSNYTKNGGSRWLPTDIHFLCHFAHGKALRRVARVRKAPPSARNAAITGT